MTNVVEEEKTAPLVYVVAAFAALCACSWGYDAGISSSILFRLQLEGGGVEMNDVQLEIFVGAMTLFSIPGALFAYSIIDNLGRLRTFSFSATMLISGILLTVSSSNFAMMVSGRAVMGVGAGIASVVDGLYISECSPPRIRGRLVSYSSTAFTIGLFVGFGIGALFQSISEEDDDGDERISNDRAWRYMLATSTFMPALMILLIACGAVPESPRFLILQGRIRDAELSLQRLRPHVSASDIAQEASDIAVEHKAELLNSRHRTNSWRYMLLTPPPYLRRMLVVGVGSR